MRAEGGGGAPIEQRSRNLRVDGGGGKCWLLIRTTALSAHRRRVDRLNERACTQSRAAALQALGAHTARRRKISACRGSGARDSHGGMAQVVHMCPRCDPGR